ncbi:transmembrane protein 71 [Bufo gargarizans]|uniref:transmembrane protein 71 n=1 Tax=Bufo gargarizans TaxID=30331 RepID=UPI001CF11471|nr:transmembrane protein 71 [Bufo gargarizans]
MNSEIFKMAAQPPMMSTPMKGKYSSLFQDIALLPYRLFGHYSRENSDAANMSPPNQSDVNMSPCRHSLRLLSNGYYVCDEDSFCWDDLGNISFSPSQCTVSYKENMVRIFRKRRKALGQRRLDLTNHGHLEDMQAPNYEDLNDIEPFVDEQIYYSGSVFTEENLDSCDSTTNLYAPALHEIAESDADHITSGYYQHMRNENATQCLPTILHHAGISTKILHPEHPHEKTANPVLPGTPQNLNNDVETCRFTYDISSREPVERRTVRDSTATTLTPSIESVSMGVGDTKHRRVMDLTFIVILLLLLCLIVWWVRFPDHSGIRTRIKH